MRAIKLLPLLLALSATLLIWAGVALDRFALLTIGMVGFGTMIFPLMKLLAARYNFGSRWHWGGVLLVEGTIITSFLLVFFLYIY